MHISVSYFCILFTCINATNNFLLAGFVDSFAENKEAVVNHGRKLLKVGVDNTNFCSGILFN